MVDGSKQGSVVDYTDRFAHYVRYITVRIYFDVAAVHYSRYTS